MKWYIIPTKCYLHCAISSQQCFSVFPSFHFVVVLFGVHKWKMCQIKSISISIWQLQLAQMDVTHFVNQWIPCFMMTRIFASCVFTLFVVLIRLDLMNPFFFTSVGVLVRACVRVKSNRNEIGIKRNGNGKCHVILEIRFTSAHSRYFIFFLFSNSKNRIPIIISIWGFLMSFHFRIFTLKWKKAIANEQN